MLKYIQHDNRRFDQNDKKIVSRNYRSVRSGTNDERTSASPAITAIIFQKR